MIMNDRPNGNGHGSNGGLPLIPSTPLPPPEPVDDKIPSLRATDVRGKLVRCEDHDIILRVPHNHVVLPPDQLAQQIGQLRVEIKKQAFLSFGAHCLSEPTRRFVPYMFELDDPGLLVHIRIAVWEFVPDDEAQVVGRWVPPVQDPPVHEALPPSPQP